MKKITITERQAHQFNHMRMVLKSISKGYKTPDQLRRDPNCDFHGFEDFISMVYENIQSDAEGAIAGVKAIKLPPLITYEQQPK